MAEYIVDMSDSMAKHSEGVHECIVRCRDCKHSNTINDHVAYCNYDPFRPLFVKPDGFCYRGTTKAE